MSTNSKRKISAATQPHRRATALAAPPPNRRSKPLAKPAPKPQPAKPRFSRPAEVMQAAVPYAAPQAAESQGMDRADLTAEGSRSGTEESLGAAREQAEKARQMTAQMTASSTAERQTPTTPNFAAYVHASTATFREMQHFGQLWVALVQTSLRHSAAMAFDWTMRR